MPLITVIITLVVIGILLWLINTYIPMDGKIKQILNVVVVICVVIWLLNVFGVIGGVTYRSPCRKSIEEVRRAFCRRHHKQTHETNPEASSSETL